MRRLALLLLALGLAGAVPAEAAAPLSRIQVVALEFHYRLSRVRVPAGPVRLELANFGQDEHNLQLQRVGSTRIWDVPSALPGQRRTVTLNLKPGRYTLTCTMADHAMLGMRAQLRVVRRR